MDQWRIDNARVFVDAILSHCRKKNEYLRKVEGLFEDIQKTHGGEKPPLDHFALRSISGIGFGRSEAGLLFSTLGYRHDGSLYIPNLNIAADFLKPPIKDLPKGFFSEILVQDLCYDERVREDFSLLCEVLFRSFRDWDSGEIGNIARELYYSEDLSRETREALIERLVATFTHSPPLWRPDSSDLAWIASKPHLQEIASVIAYGFQINHFAFLLKDPDYCLPGYTGMEDFAEMLRSSGLPMKDVVEGESGSMLRQTSTRAIIQTVECHDRELGIDSLVDWPGSYVEFVERGIDPETGLRFEGFLPNQAQKLFKMTEPR